MKNSILPIGSVILKNDKKYIIFDYDFKAKSYVCAGYPSYFLIDLILFRHLRVNLYLVFL